MLFITAEQNRHSTRQNACRSHGIDERAYEETTYVTRDFTPRVPLTVDFKRAA